MPDTQLEDDAPPVQSNRFFGWMRELDVQRRPGWIGGVATGLAARLGIDPLIVRGILVVVAILGGPAVFLYAAAWALLPDERGVIHLEELFRGRFSSAIAGVGALLILSFLPFGSAFSNGGYVSGFSFPDPRPLFVVLWVLLLIGIAVWFVVWIARRAARDPQAAAQTAAQPTDVPPPGQPVAPENPDDFAAWREQQEAVKAETEEFRLAAAATAAETAAERAREQRALWEAGVAERAARRQARRLANPRLAASWVFVILGAGLVASAIGALVASVTPSFTGTLLFAGLASAALVVGIGTIVAGLARRRSGFLSFVGIVLVVFLVPTAFVPNDRQLIGSHYDLGTGDYAQLVGSTSIHVTSDMAGVIDLWQGAGTVSIFMQDGSGAHFEAQTLSSSMYEERPGEGPGTYGMTRTGTEGNVNMYSADVGQGGQDLTIRLWQGAGSTYVMYNLDPDIPDYDPTSEPTDAPTPTPTATEDSE